MRRVQAIVVIIGLLFSLTACTQDKQPSKVTNKIEPLPRDLEMQLALERTAAAPQGQCNSIYPKPRQGL